jgi:hypothetical protein
VWTIFNLHFATQQSDLNNQTGQVGVGDTYGYNYNLEAKYN